QENPVYYVQYAHARLASIDRQARERGIPPLPLAEVPIGLLAEPEELELLRLLAGFPRLVASAAVELEPHRLVFFLLDLVGRFHSYYNKHRVISEDAALTQARLALAAALRTVIGNGLRLIGVTAPTSM
ncbi:MAG: DALR anticodon-binding domain-containing protein, partial [Thermodesulfobacteriota bacterium]